MNIDWIVEGLKKPEKSKVGLAKALGRSPSAITNILNGTRRLRADELARIAKYLEVAPPALVPRPMADRVIERIRVRGYVQAGVFREASEEEVAEDMFVTILRDPDVDPNHMFALQVIGQSINRQAADGSFVICLDVFHAPRRPMHGDWVIVRAMDHGRAETTVKQLRITDGRQELWPDSTDDRYQSPVFVGKNNGQEVSIVAFVTEFLKPATRF
mgnify:CR=1 FL=1